jgi:hypothetical protein
MTQKKGRMRLVRNVSISAFVLGLMACDSMWATHALTALEIQQVQVLEPAKESLSCPVPAEATELHRTEGVFDVALPDGLGWPYVLPVVVANNLDPAASTAADEMNNITLTHFSVELTGPSGLWSDVCPGTFDTLEFSYRLAPGATTGAVLDALTGAHALCLRSVVGAGPVVVTAHVRAKGRHGGNSVASAPLVYPITVCAGCMQQGYSEPGLVGYAYPSFPPCAALSTANTYRGDACLSPGQDAMILCCGLPDGRVLCPGISTADSTTP